MDVRRSLIQAVSVCQCLHPGLHCLANSPSIHALTTSLTRVAERPEPNPADFRIQKACPLDRSAAHQRKQAVSVHRFSQLVGFLWLN